MLRLFWKELRATWWIVALACAWAAVLVLIGDPLGFRGDELSIAAAWLLVPCALLGLRAYSSELAENTVQFMGSFPVKWWKVWIAKALSGVIQIIAVFSLAAGLYAICVPHEYRPFLAEGLRTSLSSFLPIMLFAYGAGFVVSVLMPGIPLSVAAAVIVGLVFFLPFAIVEEVLDVLGIAGNDNVISCAIVLAVLMMPVSSLLVARKFPSLSMKGRWRLWLIIQIVAMIAGSACGLITAKPSDPIAAPISMSHDGRWIIKIVKKGARTDALIEDSHTGKKLPIIPPRRVKYCGWSDDSSRVVCTDDYRTIDVITVLPRLSQRSVTLLWPTRSPSSTFRNCWSPSGDRMAVIRSARAKRQTVYDMAVVDMKTGKVRMLQALRMLPFEKFVRIGGTDPVMFPHSVVYWPSKDGGRFVPTGYFENTSDGN